jgi:hypothetical protein
MKLLGTLEKDGTVLLRVRRWWFFQEEWAATFYRGSRATPWERISDGRQFHTLFSLSYVCASHCALDEQWSAHQLREKVYGA